VTEVRQGCANLELVRRGLGELTEGVELVEAIRPVGDDKVLVFARQVGIRRDRVPVEMQAAAVATIHDERICAVDFYATREEALAAVGEAG
jgi:uncharacterized protein (UPF0261 family)